MSEYDLVLREDQHTVSLAFKRRGCSKLQVHASNKLASKNTRPINELRHFWQGSRRWREGGIHYQLIARQQCLTALKFFEIEIFIHFFSHFENNFCYSYIFRRVVIGRTP